MSTLQQDKNKNITHKSEYRLENLDHYFSTSSPSSFTNHHTFISSTNSIETFKMGKINDEADQLKSSSNSFNVTIINHNISLNYRSNWLVYVAVLCAQMSAVAMGCTFGWSSPALEDMHNWSGTKFKPEGKSQKNWIASILTLGAFIGAMFCGELSKEKKDFAIKVFFVSLICFLGLLMDYFGRKKTLIGLGIPYTIGWTLMG